MKKLTKLTIRLVWFVFISIALQVNGYSEFNRGFKPDFSTPENSFKTSLYATQNGLAEIYLEGLSSRKRLLYGSDKTTQIRAVENQFKQLNSNKAIFDSADIGVEIKGTIYSKDHMAALLIVSQTYKGISMDREEGVLMIMEDGVWKEGIVPYSADPATRKWIQEATGSDVSKQISSNIEYLTKVYGQTGSQGGVMVIHETEPQRAKDK